MRIVDRFKYITVILLLAVLYTSCSRDKFAEMNTNPDDVLAIKPEYEFTAGLLDINGNAREYYYDYNRAMYYWTQSYTTRTGNSAMVYNGSGNLNQRYGTFYNNVGAKLIDVQHMIDVLPEAEKQKYVYLRAITGIPLAYYAFYVSDVQGSIAYTEAFKARYTGLLTPTYNTQSALYDTLENQLSAIVAVLKTTPAVGQTNISSADIFYAGKVENWIKAANSLRLRIAMRLLKRDPEKMKTLAIKILADDGGLISTIDEDWKMVGGAKYGSNGDYNPQSNSEVSGAKNLVDFMWNTGDPRIRTLFQKASMTRDMFDSAKAQHMLPATLAWDGQLYRGQFANPGASSDSANAYYFRDITFSYKGIDTTLRYPSFIQLNMYYNPDLKNMITYPIITYADVCFMRAELAARGVTTESAETWYYNGIDASLAIYDKMGALANVVDYTPLTATEVANYKTQPGVVYNAATALEQISVQAYLNSYKNQNEAWATIKRTGFPSVDGTILKLEKVEVDNVESTMPRRFIVSYPSITSLNYQNVLDAITEMQKDPGFKTPDDITGRVWWDKLEN
ncbi:Starch-binding associating with outer membrane [Chitinophaga sp. CF118]|uniref:SusD/RagB family nutrient-binding outer membrane lipoprotein n=1 Tax=Chitinophaga sp. CF118 TaxID=1884367 RepID=UPI0008E4A6F7|nr:SusD/RagB family nutrient-binding outer membrane lipoprotein [Chitinophaga sp. CF118]SFE06081.1 Starch-binding associating with outer membrane [Chitinophaga sp. CF118]